MSRSESVTLRLAALIVVAGAGMLVAAACGSGSNGASKATAPAHATLSAKTPTSSKLNVVATTVQIAALTREVAGDKIQLTDIIPPGRMPTSSSQSHATWWRSKKLA